jgi:flagellar hook-basal body complex protein FliE
MYTETQEALRNSLWNFMGSMLTASLHEENRAKESVTALMSEELCKFVKNKDEISVDMVAAKPILKSAVWVLNAKITELNNTLETAPTAAKEVIQNNIENINQIISLLNNFIDKI